MKLEAKYDIGDNLFYLIDYAPHGCIVNFGKVESIRYMERKIFYAFNPNGEIEENNCFPSVTDAAIEKIKHLCNKKK